MFAAKQKREAHRRGWTLGLVPTTLLICSVLGSGYGYYVWLEITPRPQAVIQRPITPPPTPVAASVPAPAALPPLVATLAAKPAPEMETPKVAAPSEKLTVASMGAPKNKTRDVARPMDTDKSVETAKPKETVKPRIPASPATMNIVRNQDRDTVTPVLLDAYQAYQRGEYAIAAQGYREVLNKDAHNRDALLGLAAIAQQRNQEETAQYYYRQVLLLDPRDPVAQAAMSAYGANNGADTESQLKQRLSEQPRSGALNYALGNVYAEQSRWAEAQQAYFNAYTLEASNAQYAYNLAISLDHLGQHKAAVQYYQKALMLDVNYNSGFDHAKAQQRLNELNVPSR